MDEDHLRLKMCTNCTPPTPHPALLLLILYDLIESVSFARTFAPMWDVFRVSSDKLALCHLELMRKMNDLIRDINKYGEEQVKIHRKVHA